jgi:carboxyl-terminal processing protease
MLEGRPGSTVKLTIRHAAGGEVETVPVTRAPVSVRSVKGCRSDGAGGWDYLIDPQAEIAYARVTNFHENTMAEFDDVLEHLQSRGVSGLILDLRSNPGGALRATVEMVDRFIERGVIVSTVTRHQATDVYKARHEGTLPPWPMAVMINGESASASEIVAGALQDHRRAVIVGTRSFGKGVVQNVVPLTHHPAAVSLTVAHYRLPNGRIIHKTPDNTDTSDWGVLPDVVVELQPTEWQAVQQRRREVDRSLSASTTRPTTGAEAAASLQTPTILMDAQLKAALRVVREAVAAARGPAELTEDAPPDEYP